MHYLLGTNHIKLAYEYTPPEHADSDLPSVVFLGGFKSDMEGTKALYLEGRCLSRGQGYLRFDYSGHGASDGAFEDGTISRWTQDACDMLDQVVKGPVILVGSSMGGWVGLSLLLKRPKRIKGMIGIAAAPDFTKDVLAQFSEKQKIEMEKKGRVEIPNEYSTEPYFFTKEMMNDGEAQCLLDKKHEISVPLTLMQGKQDEDVPWRKALEIEKVFQGPNTKVIFIKDGDHRLSRQEELNLMDNELLKMAETLRD